MSKPLPSYRIGDLVWCRWNGGVWWPSMISYDPHDAVYFKTSSNTVTQYHIQYFGIMARRGWVTSKLLVPIQSIDEKKVTKKLGKRVRKDYMAAMAELEEAFRLELKQRKLKFIFNFSSPTKPINRKRKQDSNQSNATKIQKTFVSIENQTPPSDQPLVIQVPSPMVLDTITDEDMFSVSLEKTSNSKITDPHQPQSDEGPLTVSQPPSSTDCSQATDSGFETGSDLSNTPMVLTTPSIPDMIVEQSKIPIHYQRPLESVGNILHQGEEVKDNLSMKTKTSKESVQQKPSQTEFVPKSNCPISNILYSKCAICDNSGGTLVTCGGQCYRKFHLDCLGIIDTPVNGFVCDECILTPTACYQCRKSDNQYGDPLVPCDHTGCTKVYHKSCVQSIESFRIDDRKLICGLHSCAKCVGNGITLTSMKLIECVQCPLALHKASCLMAGCEVINDKQMVCYKHLDLKSVSLPRSVDHFNMNTCLDCGEAGSLVCCDFCSAAYHNQCLSEEHRANESVQEWLCPNCLAHDLPTYESVVMCKCGTHRWWPAEVIPNRCVPSSLWSSKPTPCMFLVKFFGTDQYFWTHHGRVIAFTDDCLLDQNIKKISDKTKQGQIQAQYTQAFREAFARYREWKSKIDELKQYKKTNRKESKSYAPIKRNKYLVSRPQADPITEPCKCTPKSPCSPSSNCINRAVYTECHPSTCPVGPKCQNQKIRLGQIGPVTTFYTGGRGWGLKATNDIENGDFVVEYVGEVLNMEMVRERLKASEEKNVSNFYFLTLGKDLVIDASAKSNYARFVNHSCDPNCQTQKWKVNGETRIGIFAIKDITAGTELTFDYMLDSLGNEKKKCLCGSLNCSGFLGVRPKNVQEVTSALESSPVSTKRNSAVIFRSNLCKNDPYDDECFVCKSGGKLLLCDYPDCCRVYHTKCIHLKRIPKTEFICPRHYCSMCSSPSTVSCTYCTTAACHAHQSNLLTQRLHEEYSCIGCYSSMEH